jgi:hypothetical protein
VANGYINRDHFRDPPITSAEREVNHAWSFMRASFE